MFHYFLPLSMCVESEISWVGRIYDNNPASEMDFRTAGHPDSGVTVSGQKRKKVS